MKKILIGLFILSVLIISQLTVFAQSFDCQSDKLIYIKYGQIGEEVKNFQSCLIKFGFNIQAGATGYYGKQTLQAVSNFYKAWYGKWHGNWIGPAGIQRLKTLLSYRPVSGQLAIKPFESKDDFQNYFILASKEEGYLSRGITLDASIQNLRSPVLGLPGATPMAAESVAAARISETTVQVKGIDEPDIVKTDGKNIYFSRESWYVLPLMSPGVEGLMPPISGQSSQTKIIKSFPPADLSLVSDIDRTGTLLLLKDKNILVIFSNNEIFGYDISNEKNPQKKWEMKLQNSSFLGARLYGDKIYLTSRNWISVDISCPIKPLILNNREISIDCREIYHPTIVLPVDAVYNVMALNPQTGEIIQKTSFVGSSSNSVLYVSLNNLYLTYSYQDNPSKFIINFFIEKTKDLLPSVILEKLKKLETYEISDGARLLEMEIILKDYQRSLDSDARLRIENELANRLKDYQKEYKREIEKTGIVRLNLDNFDLKTVGTTPGYPLNQFSLDEYNDSLRIATTIGERGRGFGWAIGQESVNDVYVLDKDLKIAGSVQDLGKGERIYSVRFIEDKGYVVTFRQVDPFYVLDLSNPLNPQLKGELKIPGYSSYLHPITKDKILGIGMESGNVKVSLFDVSSPTSPTEKAKYDLKEDWSEVLNNFHAFLLDDKHQIFFLPASNGGYIFSYKDDKLSLVKAISDFAVKRAIYLDDYLYVISENKIAVFDETNWNKVKELELK
ncbi:MAG: beta-propeller domain-containing protein [Patescibacteria group bacterium]